MTGSTSSFTVEDIRQRLEFLADPQFSKQYARYGIEAPQVLGVRNPVIQGLAKEVGKSEELAFALWMSPIHEMKHVAIHVMPPGSLTEELVWQWAGEFYSWDLCDSACAHLFRRAPFAPTLSHQLAADERLYVRRTGLVLMTTVVVHHKRLEDEVINGFLITAEKYINDDRPLVQKAISWLLRQVGKSRIDRLELVLPIAERWSGLSQRSARWIGKDVLRELRKPAIRERLEKKKPI